MGGYLPVDTPPGTAPLPLGNGVSSKGGGPSAPPAKPAKGAKVSATPMRGKARKPSTRPLSRRERR